MAARDRSPLADGAIGRGADDPELARILDRVGQRRRRRASSEVVTLRRPLGPLDGTSVGTATTVAPDPVPTGPEKVRTGTGPVPVEPPAAGSPVDATGPPSSAVPAATGRGPSSGPGGTILSVDDVGPTVRVLRIGRPSGFTYAAGQHVKIGTAGTRRGTYSIASAPHESHVEICVKLVPDGRLTPALFQVRPGDQLVSDWRAKGSFTLDERARAHVMVATAAGISPLRGLLRDARRRGVNGPVIVLHGASHPDELPYFDELTAQAARDANLRYEATVSRPAAPRSKPWTGATGRVDELAARVLATLDPGNTRVYACGNAGMIKTVVALASKAGFPVSTESFG